MEQFTIYCTAEQTKKALELGAPIEFEMECPVNLETLERSPYPDIKMGEDGEPILIIPTAEQMINWLETQGALDLYVDRGLNEYIEYLDTYEYLVAFGKDKLVGRGYTTRKEATLSAIDSALNYLSNNKK